MVEVVGDVVARTGEWVGCATEPAADDAGDVELLPLNTDAGTSSSTDDATAAAAAELPPPLQRNGWDDDDVDDDDMERSSDGDGDTTECGMMLRTSSPRRSWEAARVKDWRSSACCSLTATRASAVGTPGTVTVADPLLISYCGTTSKNCSKARRQIMTERRTSVYSSITSALSLSVLCESAGVSTVVSISLRMATRAARRVGRRNNPAT